MAIIGGMPDFLTRRTVLRTGAAAMTAASYSRILGANDAVRLGLIGCGGRGQYVMGRFLHNPEVRVVAVCDIWGDRADEAAGKSNNTSVAKFSDHRELLQKAETDVILIATPDHWHVPIALDAVDAGKDVYCEKPLTLKIEEGPAIVKAAREKKKVFQVGMQQRSGSTYLQARDEYFKTNKLGKVTMVRTWWHGNSVHLLKAPESLRTKPANLDWDRYIGPAKWRPWDPQQYWCFRAYLDFGGGQITDLFTHWIDVAHMLLGEDGPTSAVSGGGVYFAKDGRTAPDTINVVLEYPGQWNATFEATLAPGAKGDSVEIYGTEGRMEINRQGFTFTSAEKGAQPVNVKASVEQTEEHVRNFLDCLRTRKEPNGDVYVGHRSAQASHLANLAWLQKRRIMFNPDREEILPL